MVDSWLPAMCETWPQLTPWNVWDLNTTTWLMFRDFMEQRRQEADKNGNY